MNKRGASSRRGEEEQEEEIVFMAEFFKDLRLMQGRWRLPPKVKSSLRRLVPLRLRLAEHGHVRKVRRQVTSLSEYVFEQRDFRNAKSLLLVCFVHLWNDFCTRVGLLSNSGILGKVAM